MLAIWQELMMGNIFHIPNNMVDYMLSIRQNHMAGILTIPYS